MEGTKYEIWVDDFIQKVSLEELAQMTMIKKMKAVWFSEKEGKKMLINFFVETSNRILRDGTHIVKRAATGVLFTEVDEYKRMIIYDHFRGILSYVDDISKIKRYETTHILPVIRYRDDVVEAVAGAIIRKEGAS